MKILIIRLSSLGDIVITQPVTAVLQEKYPQARLDFLTKPQFKQLIEAFGTIDNIYTTGNNLKLIHQLRKNEYDVIIDLQAKLNSFLLKTITAGQKTVTYDKKHMLRRKIINHKTDEKIESTVSLYFSALKKLGINETIRPPKLNALSIKKIGFLNFLNHIKEKDTKLIGIFPGAKHFTKQYPFWNYAKVIGLAPENFKFVVLGNENEKDLAIKIDKECSQEILDLTGKLNIQELISVINILDAVVSNDSGPMHIAAALHIPQVAIFGATHPDLGFAPMNDKAVVLALNLECQPCSLHGESFCPKAHFRCLNSLAPETVINALLKLLDK
ncbi:MAG: lipopolysaccharide heptosyltransferase II [Candidatus Cloacimonadota bacterium]|nr:lipopolysaccharide heptosyltransferase II [Candidatus Cloacimonadota bacterium]